MNIPDIAALSVRLAWLLRSQYWSRDAIERYQSDRLVSIMRHAAATTPFYRSVGISPESVTAPADLSRFPVIDKSVVQEHEQALISDPYRDSELYRSRTSGSTGQPTETVFDRRAWLMTKYAIKMRRTLGAGPPALRRLLIVSEDSPRTATLSWIRRHLPVQVRRLSIHSSAAERLGVMREFAPTAIYAFPSWLVDTVADAAAVGVSLPRVAVIFTSSEVLSPVRRRQIEDAFSARTIDIYGSTEFKEVAFECVRGRRHVNFESTYVETDGSAGGRSRLILTGLANQAMPLIRYRIGDMGELRFDSCACGRHSPYITQIVGREVDLIRLADGTRISPYLLTTIIERNDSIARYQLVERDRYGVEVRYQRRVGAEGEIPGPSIQAQLDDLVGSRCRVYFSPCKEFAKSNSGKEHVIVRSAPAEAVS